ncbi:MAG: ATP-dependent zinc metalloprotease FtsH [Gammaproteobacteria bacterium]|nr:ATP-dependent zinc metalloprotease FtsH [Gammaproteobacteria bacterium]
MDPKKPPLTPWYLLGGLALLIALQFLLSAPPPQNLGYSDFKTLLRAGKLSDLSIGATTIEGKVDTDGIARLLPAAHVAELTAPGARKIRDFLTQRVEDPGLVGELDAARVQYAASAENHWFSSTLTWLLPGLLLMGLYLMMMRRTDPGTGPLAQIGRSQAKVFVQKDTGVHFADVEGIDEAKEELMEVVRFLKDPERYRRLGGHIPKGILIVGAPGTGKTLLAKAVAGEAGVPFLSISGSEFVEMFVGVGAARVRDLFRQAEDVAPCIIFVDELDALGKARGVTGIGGNDEREQTLNQLLVEMDGFDSNSRVLILAATNRPEILDPALLRPGRFDRHVAIDRPDVRGREKILRLHARRLVLAAEVDLAVVAAKTPGFAGADLANIVNEAALHAARGDKSAVDMQDFESAIDRVVIGLEKRNRVMNAREKETVAFHEAGHALIAESRPNADRVSKVSIIPRGIGALGFTQQLPTEDRYLLRRSELLDRLDVLLGGRVAEEIVFGDVSTGAEDDLQKATDMARHMVARYGMSDALGQVVFDAPRRSAFLDTPSPQEHPGYSEHTARAIDQEIAGLLAAARERVERTLRERRAALDALAHLLLEEEVVGRERLERLLSAPAPGNL